jgi:Fic family protein
MEVLMQPHALRARMLVWAEEQARLGKLPQRAGQLLEAILYRGELPRGEISTLLGIPERSARRITSELLQQGVFESKSTRAPLRLAFPAALVSRWMPGLFPEKPG